MLELDCEGSLADVAWSKDGTPIKNAGRYLIEFTETGEKMFCVVLEIDNVVAGDAGTYTCVAKNERGEAERNVVLRHEDVVVPVAVSSEVAPSFKERPKDQMGLDGDRIVGGSDLTVILSGWGGGGAGDLNGDGFVSGPDLTTMLSAWGVCP